MKKLIGLAIVSLIAVTTLGACSHGAKTLAGESSQSVSEKIVKGKTTKEQVKALFGEPSQVSRNGGEETWSYWHTKSSGKEFIPFYGAVTGNSVAKAHTLEIKFDRRGVVKSHEWSEIKI